MNIKKELQKAFPYHTIHHTEETQLTDEEYSVQYDKGKRLCLQISQCPDVYFVDAYDGKTFFSFPAFTSVRKAIAFMRYIYAYTKWLRLIDQVSKE